MALQRDVCRNVDLAGCTLEQSRALGWEVVPRRVENTVEERGSDGVMGLLNDSTIRLTRCVWT